MCDDDRRGESPRAAQDQAEGSQAAAGAGGRWPMTERRAFRDLQPPPMDVARLLNPLPLPPPEREASAVAAASLLLLTSPAAGALSIDASVRADTDAEAEAEATATALRSPPVRAALDAQLSPLARKTARPLHPLACKPPGVCAVAGCLRAAASGAAKCAAHRGLKLCASPGCRRPVQSRGACKSHGGGARCKHPACSKGAISKGRCRAHGGGTRCAVPDCAKWAQRLGCCVRHSKAVARRL